MCGLAAVVTLRGARVAPKLLRDFDRLLAHRGPDGSGLATFTRDAAPANPDAAEVALVFRRLAIIDLDPRANQPMASPDGRFMLVLNMNAVTLKLAVTAQVMEDGEGRAKEYQSVSRDPLAVLHCPQTVWPQLIGEKTGGLELQPPLK